MNPQPGLETSLTTILTTPSAIAETSLLVWLIAKGLDLTPGQREDRMVQVPSRSDRFSLPVG